MSLPGKLSLVIDHGYGRIYFVLCVSKVLDDFGLDLQPFVQFWLFLLTQ